MTDVYYLGPEDSFSEIITKKIFTKNSFSLISCESFAVIEENVLRDINSIGALPIENSITSDIHENIDFLFRNNVKIVNEGYLKINLHLIGLRNSSLGDIKTVLSHPRAILQCTDFIKKHDFQIIESLSTSAAKKILLNNKNKEEAIIGSKELVKDNPDLTILSENIGNDTFNRTRFAFVSLEEKATKGNKASVVFKVLHKPGSLAQILSEIANVNLNVTKIESRPIPGTNWEYHFWVDIETLGENLSIGVVNNLFKKNSLEYTILGLYPKGEIFES